MANFKVGEVTPADIQDIFRGSAQTLRKPPNKVQNV